MQSVHLFSLFTDPRFGDFQPKIAKKIKRFQSEEVAEGKFCWTTVHQVVPDSPLGELLKKGSAFSKLNIIKSTKADVQIC